MYTQRYKYRKPNNQSKNIKRVLTNWLKIGLTAVAIYAFLYLMCVAAGCPY